MSEFRLQIVTPDGLMFDGEAQRIIVRTTEGGVGILPRHSDYAAPVSIWVERVLTADGERKASCAGGLLSVSDGAVRLIASTFEWAEDIDVERANSARERAEKKLGISGSRSDYEYKLAQVKLKKALARISASENR